MINDTTLTVKRYHDNTSPDHEFIKVLTHKTDRNFTRHSALIHVEFYNTFMSVTKSKFINFEYPDVIYYNIEPKLLRGYTELTPYLDIKGCTFDNVASYPGFPITFVSDQVIGKFVMDDTTMVKSGSGMTSALAVVNSTAKLIKTELPLIKSFFKAIKFGGKRVDRMPEFQAFTSDKTKQYQTIEHVATTFKLSFTFNASNPNDTRYVKSVHYPNQTFSLENITINELRKGYLVVNYTNAVYQPAEDHSKFKQVQISFQHKFGRDLNKPKKNFPPTTILPELHRRITTIIPLNKVIFEADPIGPLIFKIEYTSDLIQEELSFYITLRECVPGEYNNDGICQPCLWPTYSLSPKNVCSSCPANANCTGYDRIVPLQNYWSARYNSTDIRQCRHDHVVRCLTLQQGLAHFKDKNLFN